MIKDLFHVLMKAGASFWFAVHAVVLFGKEQTTWAMLSFVVAVLFFISMFRAEDT